MYSNYRLEEVGKSIYIPVAETICIGVYKVDLARIWTAWETSI